MSIVSNYGKYTPVCDICDTELVPVYDFYSAVFQRKRAGWKSRKTGNLDDNGKPIWEDMCEVCQELGE